MNTRPDVSGKRRAPGRTLLSAVVSAGMIAAPQASLAQESGFLFTVIVPSGEFGSSLFLKELLGGLAAARVFCEQLQDDTLEVDCLAERLQHVSDEIPGGTDYDEVRAVIADTATQLGTLARQNRDRDRRRVTAGRPGSTEQTSRPLRPVSAESLASVNAQAINILEEAKTKLLRSADSKNRSQYTRIAQALDSNKVLLRS